MEPFPIHILYHNQRVSANCRLCAYIAAGGELMLVKPGKSSRTMICWWSYMKCWLKIVGADPLPADSRENE